MDSSFIALKKVIKAAGVRQKVIASNLANADTPGYKAKDVEFGSFLKKELRLKATDSNHMNSSASSGLSSDIKVKTNPSWGDENNVELNIEVAKMAENALTHNAAIKILNSKIKMYRSAITTK